MPVAKALKKCPLCAEVINAAATRCKHCHADLGPSAAKRKNPLTRLDTFRTGFIAGICFTLLILLLLYLQFWQA